MDYPITPAVRLLRAKKINFAPRLYDYEEHGGTKRSAELLKVDEHAVIKTLIFETDARKAFVVLMHGDRTVSAKQLARVLNVKSVHPCEIERAQKLTGYMVGGTSPFGTRTPLPVYVEQTIFELPQIYINGGKRGFLVELEPRDLKELLPVVEVEVAIKD
ncbi:MAG TPA: Cys-tRNA(Pro) deacylase [Pyrinomonadaceae bacterium]|jgi:Cys-tRNA(Pro) deacylase